jgi:hypothetical protein
MLFYTMIIPRTTAHDTEMEMSLLQFNLLQHSPFSPDSAPLDIRLFPDLKKELKSQ